MTLSVTNWAMATTSKHRPYRSVHRCLEWFVPFSIPSTSYFLGLQRFELLVNLAMEGAVYKLGGFTQSRQTLTGSIHLTLKLTKSNGKWEGIKGELPLSAMLQPPSPFPRSLRLLQLPLMAASGLFQGHT